jgi:ubiquinone biosynthesis protein
VRSDPAALGGVVDNPVQIGNDAFWRLLDPFLQGSKTTAGTVGDVEQALEGKDGKPFREELGKWTVRVVPVELLVPAVHRQWRPLVHEAMLFVVSKLSASRLVPKIVEQIGLAPDTPSEVRLLRFIAKVPGLQKIGQVLARNRNLDPRLRRALIKLESGISDMSIGEVRALIYKELGPQIKAYAIQLESKILSEASVSAVVGFTWRNPKTRRRERGVFKVLKPHIPGCYSEDMKILRQLAQHLARKHRVEGMHLGGLAETLTEIRLLLEREVDFPREQATLSNALASYRTIKGIRVPRLIPLLSTATITALTFERGKKVTDVQIRPAKLRVQVAERLAEALLAVPALDRSKESIFHADPHAGNVLYDKVSGELVILDWALTESLTLDQRKNVLMLVLMMILRDADGVVSAVERLRRHGRYDRRARRIIRTRVDRLLDEMSLTHWPGPMDAMRLLDEIALEGIRFPTALLMFRKASFTLEGVLEDIAGCPVRIDSVIARYALTHSTEAIASLVYLLSLRDCMAIDWSALTFTSRMAMRVLLSSWQRFPVLSTKANAA